MQDNGWDRSAQAWIADMGEQGDWGRRTFLDEAMLARVRAGGFRSALDVGCGEGRFCRRLQEMGIATTGIDPTEALLQHARLCDPAGSYLKAAAEQTPFADGAFDLVISYVSLVDIEAYEAAIAEMARVLAVGGRLLVANLTSFSTARAGNGWEYDLLGRAKHFTIDRYLESRGNKESWRGIKVINWHRPLSDYMRAFLAQSLVLTHFDEPAPVEDCSAKADKYRRVPWYVVMEWEKR
ncbi:class I SAM-dependent methyltransferase [Terriglobus albidus]|uniref:Class I SAM-dependent methyltransferase n=1 Tax=Terriglobus albidus TaxID=1592106 RepID=A0A5B9E4P5_9BACT|nr:class I SAM-dependent methyltransferase [Terriglobus albidus]QEE27273.1 class I SAM-dependent methyltransferase [Terriglobus albidus]